MAVSFRPRSRKGTEFDDDVELTRRDGCLNARYGLPYDSSIDKKLFPAATSYIILETETDNEIPSLTVGVRDAINHDKKNARSFLFVKAASVLRSTSPRKCLEISQIASICGPSGRKRTAAVHYHENRLDAGELTRQ